MDGPGDLTQNISSNHCLFQLRRIGASATCKGVADTFRLEKPKLLIGRHLAMVDVYLNSSIYKQLISRQHAVLTIEQNNDRQLIYLQDKSTNGTFLNDVKITGRVAVKEGDTLTFGHTSGVLIKPGILSRQVHSEFRFVLEKVHSENAPPSYELKVPLNLPLHQTTAACDSKTLLPRDQDLSDLGHDTQVLTDIPVVRESNADNQISRLSTPSCVASFQQSRKPESIAQDGLALKSSVTPQQIPNCTHPDNKTKDNNDSDDLTSATTSKQSTALNLKSTKGPYNSKKPCIAEKTDLIASNPSPETLARIPRDLTKTPQTLSEDKALFQRECFGNKVLHSPQINQPKNPHRASGVFEDEYRTTQNLDDELFRLTSTVSVKMAHFDSPTSEQELDTTSQSLRFGIQTFPSSKSVQKTSSTCWTKSTPCQDDLPPRCSSPVLSCSTTDATPETNLLSFSDKKKATGSKGKPSSVLLSRSSPLEVNKTEQIAKILSESQNRKRGGNSSAEKTKKKCIQGDRRGTAKHKTRPPGPQPLAPLPLGPAGAGPMPAVEVEVCDSYDCCRPTESTLAWVQCDSCDSWYHVTCVGCDYDTVKKDSAAFHCGCVK